MKRKRPATDRELVQWLIELFDRYRNWKLGNKKELDVFEFSKQQSDGCSHTQRRQGES